MKNELFKYDTLLFDADDTLFDFRLAEKNALRATLSEFNLPFDDEIHMLYHEINKNLWKEFEKGMYRNAAPWPMRFERLLAALNKPGDSDEMNIAYTKNLGKQPVLLSDAEEICTKLCKTHRLFIITNGTPSVQHSRLNASPIRDCFSGMFISGEIGLRKPDAEYFNFVFSKIQSLNLKRTLIIGDSLTSDIQGGINAGIDTCWFNPEQQKAPPELTPTYEIHSLKEVYHIV